MHLILFLSFFLSGRRCSWTGGLMTAAPVISIVESFWGVFTNYLSGISRYHLQVPGQGRRGWVRSYRSVSPHQRLSLAAHGGARQRARRPPLIFFIKCFACYSAPSPRSPSSRPSLQQRRLRPPKWPPRTAQQRPIIMHASAIAKSCLRGSHSLLPFVCGRESPSPME